MAKQATPKPYRTAEETSVPSHIAESLAVYTPARAVATKATRRITERRIAGLVAPQEVWKFALTHELIPHLETAVRLVRECFPTVQKIKLLYEIDWEVSDRSWIAIDIGDIITVGTQEVILERYNRFTREMVRQVPPDKGEKILLGF